MKTNKIIITLFIIVMVFCQFKVPYAYAANVSIGDITGGADNFLGSAYEKDENGEVPEEPFNQDSLKEVSDVVYNILLVIGIVAAVIVGMVLGIKLMTGSVSEKAEIKQMIPPYLIGCIVLFGAFTIWKIVIEMLNQTQ